MKYELHRHSSQEMIDRSSKFLQKMQARRSVRHFSREPVPMEAVRNCISAAATAPSGAHKQPWTFCLVVNPEMKRKIRVAAEQEEFKNYHGRMSDEWLKDLEPFGTDHIKPFIEEAPGLIVVFKHAFGKDEHGRTQNYYVNESVGIAVGILLTALHEIGLVALIHTPSPMNFLAETLDRPDNERAYLNIPFGFPSSDCEVPDLERKRIEEILKEY